MYGSLSQFLNVQRKMKILNIRQEQQNPYRSISQQKHNRKSLLIYETQDKSIYIDSLSMKQKKNQQIARQKLKQAIEQKVVVKKQQKQHWIQSKPVHTYNLNAKNKLLRAIAKTRQLESQDNSKTLFQKSFERINSAYSKIKTHPIDTLLPPKIVDLGQITKSEQSIPLRKKSCPANPSKILNLQNSVKWAKKHKKNFNSFYQQLGKSYQLIEQERPGKNNYQLQKQVKQKQQQDKRRYVRRKFLKQIQRRISKYADGNPQKI